MLFFHYIHIYGDRGGAKNGIFPVDALAGQYMKEHSKRPYKFYEADAEYVREVVIDLDTLKSAVAFLHLPLWKSWDDWKIRKGEAVWCFARSASPITML